jgi:glycopeptide antibiotics resistance protein
MRITKFISDFKTYFVFGVSGAMLLALLGAFGYFIIYKRLLKGSKTFSKKQLVFGGLFVAYIIMVLGVTFVSRNAVFMGGVNTHLFSTYIDAWNNFDITSWAFIILNIFMFMPFGFLLPLQNKRFQKANSTMISALLFTLSIEGIQLVTGAGIFDFDDIFNNMLGAAIGYGMIMTILLFFKSNERKGLKAMGFLSPLLITIVVFASIFTYYNAKEFGNIPENYTYKLNLINTDIELYTSLKDSAELVPIYKAPTYTRDESIKWVNGFFDGLGIDSSNLEIDDYADTVIFWVRKEPSYNIWLDYTGGSYNFTDFSCFDEGIEPKNVEKDILLDELVHFGINLPQEAEIISQGNGRYQCKVDKHLVGDNLLDGAVNITYFNDGTIKKLYDDLIMYKKVKYVSLKTEKEVFEELADGKFKRFNGENIKSIEIEDINIEYILDSKGYYQPVYSFTSIIDGDECKINIPAMS